MKFLAAVSVLAVCTNAAENGLGRLPPQAWRSWNAFHENFNQSKTTPTFYIDLLIYFIKNIETNPTLFIYTFAVEPRIIHWRTRARGTVLVN